MAVLSIRSRSSKCQVKAADGAPVFETKVEHRCYGETDLTIRGVEDGNASEVLVGFVGCNLRSRRKCRFSDGVFYFFQGHVSQASAQSQLPAYYTANTILRTSCSTSINTPTAPPLLRPQCNMAVVSICVWNKCESR